MSMKSIAWFGLILATLYMGCSSTKEAEMGAGTITPAEAFKILGHDSSFIFLDVRTPVEYSSATGHLEGAILIPVDSLENHLARLEPHRSGTIIAYCRSGVRSVRAEKILSQHGYRALSMVGGITRWNTENLPVVKEQQQ
jgi:rhodanese-related sulfurtransferase